MLLNKRNLDIEHLPNPEGVTIVRITGLDSEDVTVMESGRRVNKTQHMVHLEGWSKPLKLNNMRIQTLIKLFGEDTNNWVGQVIGLTVEDVEEFGEMVARIVINRRPVGEVPLTPVPELYAAKRSGFRLPSMTTPANPFQPAEPKTPSATPADGAVVGFDNAAAIVVNLHARGKTWDDLVVHARKLAMGHLVDGKRPDLAPSAILTLARTYIGGFPRTTNVDVEKLTRELRLAWLGTPPTPVDPRTGEVMGDPEPGDDFVEDPHTGRLVPSQARKPQVSTAVVNEEDIPF